MGIRLQLIVIICSAAEIYIPPTPNTTHPPIPLPLSSQSRVCFLKSFHCDSGRVKISFSSLVFCAPPSQSIHQHLAIKTAKSKQKNRLGIFLVLFVLVKYWELYQNGSLLYFNIRCTRYSNGQGVVVSFGYNYISILDHKK